MIAVRWHIYTLESVLDSSAFLSSKPTTACEATCSHLAPLRSYQPFARARDLAVRHTLLCILLWKVVLCTLQLPAASCSLHGCSRRFCVLARLHTDTLPLHWLKQPRKPVLPRQPPWSTCDNSYNKVRTYPLFLARVWPAWYVC